MYLEGILVMQKVPAYYIKRYMHPLKMHSIFGLELAQDLSGPCSLRCASGDPGSKQLALRHVELRWRTKELWYRGVLKIQTLPGSPSRPPLAIASESDGQDLCDKPLGAADYLAIGPLDSCFAAFSSARTGLPHDFHRGRSAIDDAGLAMTL